MFLNNRSLLCGRSYFRLFVIRGNNIVWAMSVCRRCLVCNCNGFLESQHDSIRLDYCTVVLVQVHCRFTKTFKINNWAGREFYRRKTIFMDGGFDLLFGFCIFHSPSISRILYKLWLRESYVVWIMWYDKQSKDLRHTQKHEQRTFLVSRILRCHYADPSNRYWLHDSIFIVRLFLHLHCSKQSKCNYCVWIYIKWMIITASFVTRWTKGIHESLDTYHSRFSSKSEQYHLPEYSFD